MYLAGTILELAKVRVVCDPPTTKLSAEAASCFEMIRTARRIMIGAGYCVAPINISGLVQRKPHDKRQIS